MRSVREVPCASCIDEALSSSALGARPSTFLKARLAAFNKNALRPESLEAPDLVSASIARHPSLSL
jgi:hypothetical protein